MYELAPLTIFFQKASTNECIFFNHTVPQLRVDDCGFVVGRAHLAGATGVIVGQHVTPHHAGPVVVRVETVLPAQLGGRVRGFCPHRLHGGRGHQLLTHPDP